MKIRRMLIVLLAAVVAAMSIISCSDDINPLGARDVLIKGTVYGPESSESGERMPLKGIKVISDCEYHAETITDENGYFELVSYYYMDGNQKVHFKFIDEKGKYENLDIDFDVNRFSGNSHDVDMELKD